MNTFHSQLLRPGGLLDVVTQEMATESRPLSPKKSLTDDFLFIKKIRKFLVTSPRVVSRRRHFIEIILQRIFILE